MSAGPIFRPRNFNIIIEPGDEANLEVDPMRMILGKEGGGCLKGSDEQPSVQKWTITDCHHPHTHVQVGV